MINLKRLAGLFLLVIGFFSCEEVIDLELEDAPEKYVIEAALTDQPGGAKVVLSKTKIYSAANDFDGVAGALVLIEDQLGNSTPLSETTKGVYTHPTLRGVSTKAYQLKIIVDGQTLSSTCVMPAIVPLEDVYQYELNLFDGPRSFSHVRYTDPLGVKNYYRFIEYKNGVYTKSIIVADDEFTDGKTVNQTIFPYEFTEESKLKAGDKIKLEFLTIDQSIQKYWFSVNNGAQGGNNSAAPANPVSNIKGGAIGYFSAHTIQSQDYIVK